MAAGETGGPEDTQAGTPGLPSGLLVLDADADVRRLIVAWLAPLGYRILEAAQPAAARAILASAEPRIDLLLTGIALADGSNGNAFAAEVRRDHPRTAVLIVSGYVPASPSRKGAAPGVHLLAKPFTRRHLVEAVRAALAGRTRTAA